MKGLTNMPFVSEQPVGVMSPEIVPDLLHRIEFGGISGKPLHLQAGVSSPQFTHRRPFMNPAAIPEQNDRPTQMLKKRPQKVGHMHGREIVLLKTDI